MPVAKNNIFVIVLLFVFSGAWSQKRTFASVERAVINCDKMFVTNCSVGISRLSRNSNYKLNFSATVLSPWYDNITIHLRIKEFKNNQFVLSPFHIELKVCDLLSNSSTWYMMPTLRSYANFPESCPVMGHIYINNLDIDPMKYDNLPFGKWCFSHTIIDNVRRSKLLDLKIYMLINQLSKKMKIHKVRLPGL